jgi:hypothetical protein
MAGHIAVWFRVLQVRGEIKVRRFGTQIKNAKTFFMGSLDPIFTGTENGVQKKSPRDEGFFYLFYPDPIGRHRD